MGGGKDGGAAAPRFGLRQIAGPLTLVASPWSPPIWMKPGQLKESTAVGGGVPQQGTSFDKLFCQRGTVSLPFFGGYTLEENSTARVGFFVPPFVGLPS